MITGNIIIIECNTTFIMALLMDHIVIIFLLPIINPMEICLQREYTLLLQKKNKNNKEKSCEYFFCPYIIYTTIKLSILYKTLINVFIIDKKKNVEKETGRNHGLRLRFTFFSLFFSVSFAFIFHFFPPLY